MTQHFYNHVISDQEEMDVLRRLLSDPNPHIVLEAAKLAIAYKRGLPIRPVQVTDPGANWATILTEAQRRLDAVRTIDTPALLTADDKADVTRDDVNRALSIAQEHAVEMHVPEEIRDENSAQHTPQATHLPVAPAAAEKQGEGEGERQEPSQDRWAGLGSTRPSGRRSGPHGWMS